MKQYKVRDKITQKMTRDGLVEKNENTGKAKRVSNRIRDTDFTKIQDQRNDLDFMKRTPAQPQKIKEGKLLPAERVTPEMPEMAVSSTPISLETSEYLYSPSTHYQQGTSSTIENTVEHTLTGNTRKSSKKAAQQEVQAQAFMDNVTAQQTSSVTHESGSHPSRLNFSEAELNAPELEKYIQKSSKAADRLDAARAAVPKKKMLVRERVFDEKTGRGKTRLYLEERDKPMDGDQNSPLSSLAQKTGAYVHNKLHSKFSESEKENAAVEGAHKAEKLAERYMAEEIRTNYQNRKQKPYRTVKKAEKAAEKAHANYQYHKSKLFRESSPPPAGSQSSRLNFSEAELSTPELEKYILKSNRAADRLDAARGAIPKRKALAREYVFDEKTGKGKTQLRFEEREKPMGKQHAKHLSNLMRDSGAYIHNKVHEAERDNAAVEGAHKAEELVERRVTHQIGKGIQHHKLKPYRAAVRAEKAAAKANANYYYHKLMHENPQAFSNPISRFWQKQQIKRQYAAAARTGSAKNAKVVSENARKATQKIAAAAEKTSKFVARHGKGMLVIGSALLLFIMVGSAVSSGASIFAGVLNGVLGTSYTSENSDLVATEENYSAMELELQRKLDNIEDEYPGYDEYRYDLDTIGHNPHELASLLTALLQTYTPASAQAQLDRILGMQYALNITQEVETRYRTEIRNGIWVDENGHGHPYTYTEEVPYQYHILNVSLTSRDITSLAVEILNAEQIEMFRVYMETKGNKPLVFGGGSADTNPSEDLSGVQFVNGTRPGNPELMEIAKGQVGNVGGTPYWSWYGFGSRVEWCACFVSWCYGQAGLSEPRFASCNSQGIPWFTSRGQWGARGYENIAPGDAIFFDWDLDGVADHVGLVIGTDGERVYTVEGNSGDACKIKSYDRNYASIKGYGLMNWDGA